MAEQLTNVINCMARANANLERLASDRGKPVDDIAKLWKDIYSNKWNNKQQRKASFYVFIRILSSWFIFSQIIRLFFVVMTHQTCEKQMASSEKSTYM